MLRLAAPGATFLLNSPYGPDEVWDRLPRSAQEAIIAKGLKFHVIDATAAAREVGLARRTNTILQTCFFALSDVLPRDEAIDRIKEAIAKSYGRKGRRVVEQNFAAVDGALARLHEVTVPAAATSRVERPPMVPETAPDFVRRVTAPMMEGLGDEIAVSALPVDGTFPAGTAAWEKRNVADEVPVWREDLCIQCGQCSFVCPHSVIRAKYFDAERLEGAPASFKSAPVNARGYPGARFSLQFYVEDCTGCGLCVEACPALSPVEPGVKAINLADKADLVAPERENIAFFERLPVNDRARVDFANVRGVQFLEPLFEFSGACAGCGETPYVKLLCQLFGDRLMVANATGCSSIYGGNLPVTPWTTNDEGRGPAWSNSLFEDNAEFGLGFRLAADKHLAMARDLARQLAGTVGEDLVAAILDAPQIRESEIRAQRERVAALKTKLLALTDDPAAAHLLSVVDHLVRRSVWIVGGDGWAYDIGYGGLDHVLATGRNVNMLVMDTEVYSNTGGQASKATPLGAIAKFAAAGKRTARKDLALQAIAYGNVYVAQVAMGANPQQTLQAFREAEAYDGPSIILAYSHCIAHGFDLRQGLSPAGQGGRDRATGRCCATTRRCGRSARRRSGSTARDRRCRSRTMPITSCATARWRPPGPTTPRPFSTRRSRRSATSTAPMRISPRWRPGRTRRRRWAGRANSEDGKMDLTTTYLGLELPSPLVASASPLNRQIDTLRRLQDCGAGAVVLPSVFEEQIVREQDLMEALIDRGSDSFGEALSYFPAQTFALDTANHLALVERAAAALDIPVIASLNGVTENGWIDYARDLESAGARAIELNIFLVPSDPAVSGAEIEKRYVEIVGAVAASVAVPVAVKIGPYFSAPGHMAGRLVAAGAKGLVLFNRFYEPDIDPATLSVQTSLDLSHPSEMRLPLLWIGVLAGRIGASLAATTGVETAADVVKYLLAGADAVMTTSALLRHGPEHMRVLTDGLGDWLSARGLASPDAIRGRLSHGRIDDPEAYERANYIKVLQGFGD